VLVVSQANGGAGAARNRGVERAAGDYVAIVDADDTWAPQKLERQVAAMDQNPLAGLCYTNAVSVRGDGTVLDARMIVPHRPLTCRMAVSEYHPIVTSTVMFRRRFLERHPYRTDLRATEDFHVNLKVLWRSGERSVFIDEPLVFYRVLETSVLRQADPWERGRLALRAVETFFEDMRCEKPVPQDIQRPGIAYSRFMWAWYCIHASTRYRFAMGQLVQAVQGDPTLACRAGRQVVKLVRNVVLASLARG
jgi:glycosyltransferase involved in cell wall biosynthesis